MTTSEPPAVAMGSKVHFVGIGGAGMSGIARIMRARGIEVSGSDAKDSRTLTSLRALGIEVFVGHDASHVQGADAVVVSTAISESNIERQAAQAAGIPVLRRAEALAQVMAGRRSIAVAGTHGKTTTTSLLTVALQRTGVDPSFAIGGDLNESGANAHDGSGDLFVAEADESDGSFLLLHPFAAIVTNVEADHLDHYGTADAVDRAFREFLDGLDPGGFAIVCADDDGSRRLAAHSLSAGVDVRTYGEAEDADLRITNVVLRGRTSSFEATWRGVRAGRVELQIPGRHNVLNAAAALAAGLSLGAPVSGLIEGLGSFTGTRRRFEPKGGADGVSVYDDYAHHPTEITATLLAARALVGEGRLVVVFQPHRYSRTAAFLATFGSSLAVADELIVMEVYPAGEDPIPGASGGAVADAAVAAGARSVGFIPSWSAVAPALLQILQSGDVLMTLGAGDVTLIGPEVVSGLGQRRGTSRV